MVMNDTRYTITVNECGYLPTDEPYDVVGLDDLRDALINEARNAVDGISWWGAYDLNISLPDNFTFEVPLTVEALEEVQDGTIFYYWWADRQWAVSITANIY